MNSYPLVLSSYNCFISLPVFKGLVPPSEIRQKFCWMFYINVYYCRFLQQKQLAWVCSNQLERQVVWCYHIFLPHATTTFTSDRVTRRERGWRERKRGRGRERRRESERERRESGWVCVRKKGNFSLSCSNKNETPRFYGAERKWERVSVCVYVLCV